ncbi:hypothetical protein TrST_g12455 [Triparma strigata]|uniref:O-GlcNAc transferase C-terminal domain-containing protein n=1 Tax=Triparma strigata TaxID=1606541 RepID=A0A9W7AYK9_9STRA|nr:hypothetical protein TrST_g12455 [Triparma strigata]
MENGAKATRLQVLDSENEVRYTSDPVPKVDMTPPATPAFDFEVMEWESAEHLCRQHSPTPYSLTQKQYSFILYQTAGNHNHNPSPTSTPPPHQCLLDAFEESYNYPALASLAFQQFNFDEAKAYLLKSTAHQSHHHYLITQATLTTATTITSALLGEHVRSIDPGADYDFDGASALLLAMPPKTPSYSSSIVSLLQTTINRLKHFERWNDLHMALALELSTIGLESLAQVHTAKVAKCDEFVTKKWLLEQERFFCLQQCLNSYSPTTLLSLEEAEKRRVELMELMNLWIAQNANHKMRTSEPHIDIGIRHAFLAVYQGLKLSSDVAFYAKMNELHRSFTAEGLLDFTIDTSPPASAVNTPPRRVGLISNNLRFHSVGRLVRGVFSSLSPKTIHLTVISDERSFDDSDLQARADNVVFLSADIDECQKEIAALNLDVLVFADLGMDAKTSYLAYSRLAKTQISFWGHPVSFNLTSIDYSMSGENFGSFQETYGEQLVTFEGITTKFSMDIRESPEDRVATLTKLGLSGVTEETRIYLCFQSIMKLHPSFDDAILSIANLDPSGIVVLMSDTKKPGWQTKVKQRLQDHPSVQFLDAMPYGSYMKLVTCSHVTLDPYPFGGGVTIFESLSSGIPVVSDASKLKVFNFATAWNSAIGRGDDEDEDSSSSYAERAVELAKSVSADRNGIAAEIKTGVEKSLLNRSSEAEEWEAFLLNV